MHMSRKYTNILLDWFLRDPTLPAAASIIFYTVAITNGIIIPSKEYFLENIFFSHDNELRR